MHNWFEILTEKGNHVITFKSARLAEADFVFAGSTDNLVMGSRRYRNFENVFMKTEPLSDYGDSIYYCSSYSVGDLPETMNISYMTRLYESFVKQRKFEEWDLSYFQLNFETEREEIEAEVAKSFGSLEQVLKVFSYEDDDSSVHFQVLTNNSKYDRSIMMKMLNIEYEIVDKYDDTNLFFEYIPKIYESESEVVKEAAQLIYRKPLLGARYEFATSSLATSPPQQAAYEHPILVSVTV